MGESTLRLISDVFRREAMLLLDLKPGSLNTRYSHVPVPNNEWKVP